MTHLGLFEGIGGFALAAKKMGWQTKVWCEWDPFCQTVLRYHFPEAAEHGDITKTGFTQYANTIDLLTGGFPCQPYSTAGKRQGKADERHLWPEMLRAIREVQPRWVVGENVLGIVNWSGGMVFDEVQTDLETAFQNSETYRSLKREGYESFPYVLPACAVNAPHRRNRVWFVAYRNSNDARRCRYGETGEKAHSCKSEEKEREWLRNDTKRNGKKGFAAYADGIGLRRQGNRLREPGFFSEESTANDWENFPTQSPLCTRNDGLSAGLDGITFSKWRNESIKAAGNAIVHQVAMQVYRSIEQMEILFKNA